MDNLLWQRTVLFLILSFYLPFLGVAQDGKTVNGTVVDNNTGEPIPGVSILEKGTSNGVATDLEGRFSLDVNSEDPILVVSFIGMVTQEISVGTRTKLMIRMEEDVSQLGEVVVTGYQTQRKADLTGAVSVAEVETIKDIPLGNPMKSLQGRVPGVSIATDGSPQSNATVRIRGIGTLGNNNPLYVIDGVPTTRGLQEINQYDIESIQILKDASSASIYGSRAANGVIIVRTKQGSDGSKINFNASTSLEFYTTKLKTLNTHQRGERYWRAAVNDGADPNDNQIYQYDWNDDYENPMLNQVILPEFIDPNETMRPADTYWYDEISQPSITQNYDLSIANSSDKGDSRFSLSYFDKKGIVKETFMKRITARFNTEYGFLDDRLKIGENFSATYMQNSLIPTSDVMFTALVQQPIVPVHTIDGGWGGPAPGMTDRHNPVRLIEDNVQNKNHFFRVFGNAYVDYEILTGLNYKTTIGIDYNTGYDRTLRKSYSSGYLSDPSNMVRTSNGTSGNWIWNNTLNYNFNVSNNHFDFLLGHEQIDYIDQGFAASRQGYTLENIDYSYLNAGSSNINNEGSGSAYSLLSFFGKVNYSYDDTYLASFTIRRDGSSRFGRANRFGTFPAFSVGWRMVNERFIEEGMPFFSDLKLRFGWGINGNQEIANYAAYGLYAAIYDTDRTFGQDGGTAYDIDGNGTGQLPSGFVRTQQGNDSLRWESTVQSNFGLDFGLFNNSLMGSVDYFLKRTSDILISPPYLAVIGEGGNRWMNGASMQNKGLEMMLSYSAELSADVEMSITGNLATYRNEVTYLPEDLLTAYPGNGQDKTIINQPINAVFGYVADGIFASQGEVDAHAEQPGKGLGRIRFKDINNDNVIDDKDRDYIGSPNPDFTYGLSLDLRYGNFDLNLFFQGVKGGMVYNETKTYTDFSSIWPGTNWGARTLDAWTPEKSSSTIPALSLADRNNENRTSTYFLENGSYFKLRNIQLAYSFDNLSKGMDNLRVFVQGSNLFTLKNRNFSGPDPESAGYGYPIPSIATIGLNAKF